MKKQAPNKKLINIDKIIEFGSLPLFVGLGHRHFEKEMPETGYNALKSGDTIKETGKYTLPVDLAAMVLPVEYIDQIESIELLYERYS